MEVPVWATCIGEDNRPVPVPVWLLKDVLKFLNVCSVRTPCYAAELDDRKEDIERLLELMGEVENEG